MVPPQSPEKIAGKFATCFRLARWVPESYGPSMVSSDRVKQILSWYASDNPGTKNNLARMMLHGRLAGTGKMVILPVDQGFEHGPARSFAPNPGGYDPDYHYQLAIDSDCN